MYVKGTALRVTRLSCKHITTNYARVAEIFCSYQILFEVYLLLLFLQCFIIFCISFTEYLKETHIIFLFYPPTISNCCFCHGYLYVGWHYYEIYLMITISFVGSFNN